MFLYAKSRMFSCGSLCVYQADARVSGLSPQQALFGPLELYGAEQS